MTISSFDAVLAMELGPSLVPPGNKFALKVERRIAAEELLRRSRLALLRNLARDLAALALFAGALVMIARIMPPAVPSEAVVGTATLLIGLWFAVALSNWSGGSLSEGVASGSRLQLANPNNQIV